MVPRLAAAVLLAGAAGLVLADRGVAQKALTPQATALTPSPTPAPPSRVDVSLFRTLTWRSIGPFRAGPVTKVTGVPGQANTFLAAAEGGGLWRTTDAGRTWRPLFDDRTSAVLSAFALAPASPGVIYAATGDGLFRSSDAGRAWTRLGLPEVTGIADIAIDSRDANHVAVAVRGDRFADDPRRGVYGSTDGGRTFTRLLASESGAGMTSVQFAPGSSTTIYAVARQSRLADWFEGELAGTGTAIHLSEDAGRTWRVLGGGLPSFEADGLTRLDLVVAPSLPSRLFVVARAARQSGLYRSDDRGATFARVSEEPALAIADGDAPPVAVDPRNADIIYAGATGLWRSTDGGRRFSPWRHDPGVGSLRHVWLSPATPDVLAVATDRGAVISVNGGETWSSADNQPTASFTSVTTDTAFPYRVCGGEAAHTPLCVASRGDEGRITARDWRPVSADPSGRVAVDPLDPEIVYSGDVLRFDRRTGQAQHVSPPGPDSASLANAPLLFAPTDARTLFFGGTSLWRSNSGGAQWTRVSDDLTRPRLPVPATSGWLPADGTPSRPVTVSALAPSSLDGRVIWVGTSDGQVHATRDAGVAWRDVTPGEIRPWHRIASIEASRFDPSAAYVAVQGGDPGTAVPQLLRTRDAGVSWESITTGLPPRGAVHAVREDAFRRGLLFAATATGVSVSFDDGASWQSLRLNLPALSAIDLVVKDADVIIATAGRGFWILDDISPLRQVTADVARADAFLFRPSTAWRSRARATVQPASARDEPAAANPPDGVVLSYLLGLGDRGTVTLEIIETATGETIRRFSSADTADGLRLDASAGLHRVVWDLRFAPPTGLRPAGREEAGSPAAGVFVLPGTYQVRLTVNGRPLRQAVVVRMDPRVRTSIADLTTQYTLARAIDVSLAQVTEARQAIARRLAGAPGDVTARLRSTAVELDLATELLSASFHAVQSADARPTMASETAAATALARANAALDTARGLPPTGSR